METLAKTMKLSAVEIKENKQNFLKRAFIYKSYGYDQIKSRQFILRKAEPIKGKVLEIGTGKGYFTVMLAKKCRQVITVDISKEDQRITALNLAAENVLNKVKFAIFDAAKSPYPDHYFDLVISVNAFHHFERPFAVLSEMIRVCKSKLVIADYNNEGFSIIRDIHRSEGREHKEGCGDFNIVGTYLRVHGFRIKRHEGRCQIVYVAKRPAKRRR